MISVIRSQAGAGLKAADEFLIPAGGRRMEMDWDRIAAAFGAAIERLGWTVDLELRPERQYVLVRVPEDQWQHVTRTTSELYSLVEEAVGLEQFMSIWIDFASRDETCSIPANSWS